MPVYHLEGPPTSKVSRVEAEAKLQRHPALPKGADYDLWDQGGRWVAAWHQSAPFGQPADDEEEAPGPKSEGPDDTAPESPDGLDKGPEEGDEESPDEGGEDGPPKGDKKEKGEKEDVKLDHEIYDLLQKIVVALGISEGGPEDSPVPGEDEPPAPGPPGPPAAPPHPGAGGPPGGPEKPMKPGEAPPGTTPVGAPAFASVADDHPWRHLINDQGKPKTASFFIEEPWSADRPVAEFESLARRVAHGTGFEVKQTRRANDEDGTPVVRALVQATDLSLR